MFVCGYTLLVFTSTVVWLGSLRIIFRILIVLDNVVLVYIVVIISFYGMIGMLDTGEWPYLIIKIGFVIQSLSIQLLCKLMLLWMKWSRIKIIIYKLSLLANSAMLVALSGHYFTVNFSFTRYYMPSLDDKVKDYVMLYLFGLFAFLY